MIRIEEIISNALAGIEETEVAILARELLKTREALALAQQAKGDAEGRAALADRRALGMRPHVFAAMVNAVRDLALQYGQTEQFRCRVADLLSQYIHVQHNSKGVTEKTEAPAVAVPELTPGDCLELDEILQEGPPYDDVIPKLAAWICEHSRAIPADRVLGDGMVAVDREDLGILKRCFVILHRWGDYWLWSNEANRQHWQSEKNEVLKMVYDRQIGSEALTQDAEHRNALRANHGGADHGND